MVVAGGVKRDESDTCVMRHIAQEMLGGDMFVLVKFDCHIAKHILSDARDKMTGGAKTRRAGGLIGPFTARPHVEI